MHYKPVPENISEKPVLAFATSINGNLLDVQIRNRTVQALIDSGASVRVISLAFLNTLRPKLVTPFGKAKHSLIYGVGGHSHHVVGSVTLNLNIDSHVVSQTFHILHDPPTAVILGMDFLQAQHANLDVANQRLTLSGNRHEINLSPPASCATVLRTHCKITVPAASEAVFSVKRGRNNFPGSSHNLLIEPLANSRLPLLVARVLVKNEPHKTLCRVLNPTGQEIQIPAHFPIAKASYLSPENIMPIPAKDAAFLDLPIGQEAHAAHVASASDCDPAKLDPAEKQRYIQTALDMGINLADSCLTPQEKEDLLVLLGKNRDVFAVSLDELTQTDFIFHDIQTVDDIPVCKPFYSQTPAMRKEIERMTQELLDKNLIEESTSPYSSPIVLIRKSDHTPEKPSYRYCTDFRLLNRKTVPQYYPLPRTPEMLSVLGEARPQYYCRLDLRCGFHQILLTPDAQRKSAFTTHQGHFNWRVMAFGLTNAPVTFAYAMSKLFRDMTFKQLLIYVDDLLTFANSVPALFSQLQCIFDRLRSAGFKLHPGKCEFAKSQISYLGYLFSKDGMAVDPGKTKVITEATPPKNAKKLKSFLGLCQFYKKFIRNFSIIASPLYNLLRQDQTYSWDDRCQQAFETLKQALVSPPILVYPDMDKPFILSTDASDEAISYILSQKDEHGRERVISFSGRSLTGPERRYIITEKEALAVIQGIKCFREYLTGHFTIKTDHAALKYFRNLKDTSPRLQRWSLLTQGLSYDVVHVPGHKHTNADGISRLDHPPCETGESDPLESVFPDPSICTLSAHETRPLSHSMSHGKNAQYTQINIPLQRPAVLQVSGTAPQKNESEHTSLHECPSLSHIDLPTLQQRCPQVGPIHRYLKLNELPSNSRDAKRIVWQADQYGLEDNLLVHFYTPRCKGVPKAQRFIRQVVIPERLQESVLQYFHHTAIGAHAGFLRMYNALRQRYFWPNMYEATYQYTQSCPDCQRAKQGGSSRPPLIPIYTEPYPFSRVAMDIAKLPRTKDGMQYVLTITDAYSGWPEAFPLKDQSAQSIAEVLYTHVLCRHGHVGAILTDRGPNVAGEIISSLSRLFGVKKLSTSAYRPQADGLAESTNRSVIQALRCYGPKANSDWPSLLPAVLLSYRLAPNQKTGLSPYSILHGRELNVEIDFSLKLKPKLPSNVREYLAQTMQNLEIAQEIIEANLKEHKQRYKAAYDRTFQVKEPNFALAQRVLMKNDRPLLGVSTPKLKARWIGPLYITKIHPHFLFSLRWCDSNKLLRTRVHASKIKAYRQPMYRTLRGPVDFQPMPAADATGAEGTASVNPPSVEPPHTSRHSLADTNPSSVTGSQGMDDSDDTFHEVERIMKCTSYKGQKWYHVRFKNAKKAEWVLGTNISPHLIELFHCNKTLSGKAKKRRNPTAFC